MKKYNKKDYLIFGVCLIISTAMWYNQKRETAKHTTPHNNKPTIDTIIIDTTRMNNNERSIMYEMQQTNRNQETRHPYTTH